MQPEFAAAKFLKHNPPSPPKHVCTPGSTNRHTRSAFMVPPSPPLVVIHNVTAASCDGQKNLLHENSTHAIACTILVKDFRGPGC